MDIRELAKSERSPELVETLASVWERSVRATHDFLTAEDIAGIAPEVPCALANIASLAIVYADGQPIAFAGAQNGKLEMLFVDPGVRKRGVGRALLVYAIDNWAVHCLDVNEQNPQACGFYEHEGFAVVARSAHDGAGRPFPLLHLGLTKGARAEMRSGEWFDATVSELAVDRERARVVVRRYNGETTLSEDARVDLLRELFGAWGLGSSVSDGAKVDYGYNIFIGTGCFFNFNCTFLDGAPIVFGDGVCVGPNCTFATPLHPLIGEERAMQIDADGVSRQWERNLPIVIGDDVWLASNVTVNPGVTIGEGAVVGSGSVVTKDIPPHTLAFGNPCRVVRAITEEDRAF